MATLHNFALDWARKIKEFDRLADDDADRPNRAIDLARLERDAGRLRAEQLGNGQAVTPTTGLEIGPDWEKRGAQRAKDRHDLAVAYWQQAVIQLESEQPSNSQLVFALERYRLRDGDRISAAARVHAEACAILAEQAEGHQQPSPRADGPPLGSKASAVLRLIQSIEPPEGITGPEIVLRLDERGVLVEPNTLTRHIIPNLKKHYGVTNKRGVGYYIRRD